MTPELLVGLDRSSPVPLGFQLQEQFREAIRTGRLGSDDRVPSTRQLATSMGLSRGLVVEVYTQLEAEGYLSTVPGSGTRVSCRAAPPCEERAPEPARGSFDVDFEYGEPDLVGFPMREWLRALAEAAERPIEALGNRHPQGSLALREVVAAYVRRVRGSVCDPQNVVICAGFVQGLRIITSVRTRAGRPVVAIEDHRPTGTEQIIQRSGGTFIPIPVDHHGITLEPLIASSAQTVVVTPAHQAPTGVVLAPHRRQGLVAWARRTDAYIVEDDYDAEFRYDRQPVGSLQGLAPDRVVSIGTVSKSLALGLRLGWIICPPSLVDSVVEEKQWMDRGTPGLDQMALAWFMETGRYDRHLRRMRATYRERREALVQAIHRHAPGAELFGLDAGLHAVVCLDPALDEADIIARAADRGVGVYGMSGWRSGGSVTPPRLVLGFGSLTPSAIERGIAAIGDLLVPG